MKNQIITKQQPHERRVIFQKSLIEMNEFFSSTEFAAKCRENGLSVNYTGSGLCGEFLQTTAKRLTNRTWQRKNYISCSDVTIKDFNTEFTEEKCIAFLKATGKYKILVKYVEFKEI
jgi:hypothetical protein